MDINMISFHLILTDWRITSESIRQGCIINKMACWTWLRRRRNVTPILCGKMKNFTTRTSSIWLRNSKRLYWNNTKPFILTYMGSRLSIWHICWWRENKLVFTMRVSFGVNVIMKVNLSYCSIFIFTQVWVV